MQKIILEEEAVCELKCIQNRNLNKKLISDI